jgi:hypothetical protein
MPGLQQREDDTFRDDASPSDHESIHRTPWGLILKTTSRGWSPSAEPFKELKQRIAKSLPPFQTTVERARGLLVRVPCN